MDVEEGRTDLSHVADGETSQRWVVGESLHTHGLGGNHLHDGRITRLDELGRIFDRLAGTAIDLLNQLGELAGNVGSVAIQHWGVTGTDLARVVEDNDLSIEGFGTLRGVVLGVTSNVTTADFLDGHVLDVEADIVTWDTLGKLLVVHLNRLDFSGDGGGSEGNDLDRSDVQAECEVREAYHAGLDSTSLNTTDRHRPNTTDLVDILERETKGLIGGTRGRVDAVDGLEQGLASGLGLGLLLPSLVPWAVGGDLDHVITVETRDGHKGDGLGVVADLLDEGGSLLDDLLETVG